MVLAVYRMHARRLSSQQFHHQHRLSNRPLKKWKSLHNLMLTAADCHRVFSFCQHFYRIWGLKNIQSRAPQKCIIHSHRGALDPLNVKAHNWVSEYFDDLVSKYFMLDEFWMSCDCCFRWDIVTSINFSIYSYSSHLQLTTKQRRDL